MQDQHHVAGHVNRFHANHDHGTVASFACQYLEKLHNKKLVLHVKSILDLFYLMQKCSYKM